jgi:ABC-2 type transport system permease protein
MLYARLLLASVRSQLAYRASFLLLASSHFAITFIEYLAVVALFQRFGSLRGWKLAEVSLLYGMVNISFALAEAAARGFDSFAQTIRSGELDRLLLRPRSVILQVAAQELHLMRVGRFIQGAVILGWALRTLDVAWSVEHGALIVSAIVGGACTFSGLFVLQGTLAFWTVETLEIVNTVTYGGTETAQLPFSIYKPWFRAFFTFVVPLACANYFPALAVLGRSEARALAWASPLIGVLFLIASLRVFDFGLRHYRSTGS